jgi:hypothetical protein
VVKRNRKLEVAPRRLFRMTAVYPTRHLEERVARLEPVVSQFEKRSLKTGAMISILKTIEKPKSAIAREIIPHATAANRDEAVSGFGTGAEPSVLMPYKAERHA